MNKYIANIVCDGFLKPNEIFNIVEDIESIDNRFPTLIIGWELVKNIFPDASILNWKINENIYWTHKKNVKRTRYEEDMKNFKDLSIKRINSNVKFNSINLFEKPINLYDRFLNYISSGERKFCFLTEKEIYVYSKGFNEVIGFSYYEIEYLGFDKKRLKNRLSSNGNILIYNEFEIPKDIKNNKSYKKYIVPFLISLFHNE